MARYGLIVDLTKCVGCSSCTVACQAQWELEPEERWLRVEIQDQGAYPSVGQQFLTVQCQHCDDAPCVRVCPTGANYKRPDGLVLIHEGRCIGCKYCVVACPYQARVFNEARGTPGKCRLCDVRIQKGVLPACVLACPAGARYFGDFDDPNSEVSRLLTLKKAKPLRPDLRTGPNIFYVR
ncbi:MAG: 4Fe-4S dicluster domain-containing protein [Dehalococcoidia bacterium]|nr:4Fe-4S dicluster domain-containing protein [Dehalococcoidia bacterium]